DAEEELLMDRMAAQSDITRTGVARPMVHAAEARPRKAKRGWGLPGQLGRSLGKGIVEFKKGREGEEDEEDAEYELSLGNGSRKWRTGGMFHYVVDEGERVMMRRSDGTMEVLVGPRRVWAWGKTFAPMRRFTAHPGEFLIVRFRDGRQEHLVGPV